jgi:hypothetical protein
MKTVLRNGIPIGLFAAMVLSVPGRAQAQPAAPELHHPTIVVIDAPEAGAGPGDPSCSGLITCPGTVGKRINAFGELVGFSLGDDAVYHGFIRDTLGNIPTFRARGMTRARFREP